MKEFKLSDKIIMNELNIPNSKLDRLIVEDVKEFIKRLKEELGEEHITYVIDKLSGNLK